MASLGSWVWLSTAAVSVRSKYAVAAHFGDAERAFLSSAGSFAGIDGISAHDAEVLERRDDSRVGAILDACEEQGLTILTLQDAAYPFRLKNIFAPPVVLYVKGRLPDIDSRAVIAVIGTRKASVYGLKMGRRLAYEIACCGGVVVSGLTSGIDAEAARGALMADGLCIGVLGTAHEQEHSELAKDVAARGALVSEIAPGIASQKSFFRDRNRISAGLSVGVVAVEAPERSGTRLFVAEAAEQGKEIFAVPGNVDAVNSVGTLEFLRDGAKLATCGWDVMSEFCVLYPELHPPVQPPPGSCKPGSEAGQSNALEEKNAVDKREDSVYIDWKEQLSGLTAEQLQIVAALGKDSQHVDDIIEKTGLPTARVLVQLTVLEIKGILRREPGRHIALNIVKK